MSVKLYGDSTVWDDLMFPATAINPAGAANPAGIDTALLQFDIHYEIDSLGSELEFTK